MRKHIRASKGERARRGAMSTDSSKAALKKLWRAIEDRTVP